MKKYYDLIVSLIKSNRRYPGCEDILEDIVNDVYAHAEVVMDTVTNKSVIESYLSKIVTTSMITVPKRLGVSSIKKKTVSVQEIVTSESALHEELPSEFSETADNNVSDSYEDPLQPETDEISFELDEGEVQPLNEIDEDSYYEENSIEENSDEPVEEIKEEVFDNNISEDNLDDVDNESEYGSDNTDEMLDFNDTVENSEDDLQVDNDEIVPDVDKTLVDKMINGVTIEENIPDEVSDIEDDIDDTDYVQEEVLVEENSDNNLQSELSIDDDNQENTILESDIEQESELNLDLDEDDVTPLEEFNIAEGEVSSLEQYETEDENIEVDEVESDEQNTEGIEIPDNEKVYDKSSGYKLPSYDSFVFAPQSENIDYSEIIPEIDELSSKYPEMKVLDVFRLKYREKSSIDDIAAKLGLSEEDVLKTLNELMYIVKE